MSMDDLLYGNALRGAPNRYASKMAVNRTQIRNLLLPGKYQWDAKRGIPFTDDEFEAVVDAYMANGSMTDAKRVADGFIALPLVLQSKQRQLTPLRSVSAAYKQSQIPIHFRSNQKDASHVHRRSTQKAPRHTPQPPDTRWHGGHEAGAIGPGGGVVPYNVGLYLTNSQQLGYYASHQQLYSQQFNSLQAAANYGGVNQLVAQHFQMMAGPALFSAFPPKPLPTEIKAGEIVAWRAWALRGSGDNRRLHSVHTGDVWLPGTPMTGHPKDDVGVHAWKRRGQAEAYALAAGRHMVIGQVELWGGVIEHEMGYRAEHAAIHSLVGGVHPRLLRKLRRAYGLPVLKRPSGVPLADSWAAAAAMSIMIGAVLVQLFLR